jgi:hypothetical protein
LGGEELEDVGAKARNVRMFCIVLIGIPPNARRTLV